MLPVHCTLYRNESDEILLVPEPEGRTLVDGNRVMEEVNLRQGAMLTVGKANYLRFNNPAEAELIRSTMGSDDRLSMPPLDFKSNDSSPTAEGSYYSRERHVLVVVCWEVYNKGFAAIFVLLVLF